MARVLLAPGVLVALALVSGCANGLIPGGDNDATVEAVATKANAVASSVGGQDGYGGSAMDGYGGHLPERMGFDGVADLSPANSTLMIRLRNEFVEPCTFELSYLVSHMGLDEQTIKVDVGALDDKVVEIPCPEILGFGALETPGAPGCHLADGQTIDNTMALPGFLGQDFACGGVYECVLTVDLDDLDGDGDTDELILLSEAMGFHMMNGGPLGHHHGSGFGMMGPHMHGTPADGDPQTLSDLIERAEQIAELTGGSGGFGQFNMDGYRDHMPLHMGYSGHEDLAPVFGRMFVQLTNDANEDCVFDVSYIASHIGLEPEQLEVGVGAQEQVTIEMPCAEILGVGPLDEPGGVGCVLAGGETVSNAMAVPAFLGQDFVCGSTHAFKLQPDREDLDDDGDFDELVIVSEALEFHMMNEGPFGHMHGMGPGMMGPHMGHR